MTKSHLAVKIAGALVGDVFEYVQGTQGTISEHIENIMTSFMPILSSKEQDRMPKASIFCACGSIALSAGADFVKHLPTLVPLMKWSALEDLGPSPGKERLNVLGEEQCEIVSSLTCIVQGLNDCQQVQKFVPFLEATFDIIAAAAVEAEEDDRRGEQT